MSIKPRWILVVGLWTILGACAQPTGVSLTGSDSGLAVSNRGVTAPRSPDYQVLQIVRPPWLSGRPNSVSLATHLPTEEALLLRRINRVRRLYIDLPYGMRQPLILDAALSKAAQAHGWQMAINGSASLEPRDGKGIVDRLQEAGATYTAWASSFLGPMTATTPTAAVTTAIEAMNSNPSQRSNLYSARFTRVGIGIYQSTMNQKLYCAVVFAD